GKFPARMPMPLQNEPWFFDRYCSRSIAEQVLRMPGNRAGAFLVRRTQQQGWSAVHAPYVLSLLVYDDRSSSAFGVRQSSFNQHMEHPSSCPACVREMQLHQQLIGKSGVFSPAKSCARTRLSLPSSLEKLPTGLRSSNLGQECQSISNASTAVAG